MKQLSSQFAGMAEEVMAEYKAVQSGKVVPYQSKYGLTQKNGGSCQFFTPKRLAELLGVSVKKLERMRKNGTGPAFKKIGNDRIHYYIKDVDLWLDAISSVPQPPPRKIATPSDKRGGLMRGE